ncbi:MAG: hypothetical protein ACREQ5_15805, partial [Candidatus Dormibacteria bacterium]
MGPIGWPMAAYGAQMAIHGGDDFFHNQTTKDYLQRAAEGYGLDPATAHEVSKYSGLALTVPSGVYGLGKMALAGGIGARTVAGGSGLLMADNTQATVRDTTPQTTQWLMDAGLTRKEADGVQTAASFAPLLAPLPKGSPAGTALAVPEPAAKGGGTPAFAPSAGEAKTFTNLEFANSQLTGKLKAGVNPLSPTLHGLYDAVGAPRGSDLDTVKKAYRKNARALHPDANPQSGQSAGSKPPSAPPKPTAPERPAAEPAQGRVVTPDRNAGGQVPSHRTSTSTTAPSGPAGNRPGGNDTVNRPPTFPGQTKPGQRTTPRQSTLAASAINSNAANGSISLNRHDLAGIRPGTAAVRGPGGRNGTVTLTDANGQTQAVEVLGTRSGVKSPTSLSDVLLPGEPPRAQNYQLSHDPMTWQPVIVRRVRGGSVNQDPELAGTQQTPETNRTRAVSPADATGLPATRANAGNLPNAPAAVPASSPSAPSAKPANAHPATDPASAPPA